MIKLTKSFTRELSLFYLWTWSESNLHGLQNLFGRNVRNLVMLVEAGSNRMTAWYDEDEIADFDYHMACLFRADSDLMFRVRDDYLKYWRLNEAYVKDGKEMKNWEEAKMFYENWLGLWPSLVVTLRFPDIPDMDSEISEIACQLRNDTQEYIDNYDKVLNAYFARKYSEFSDIKDYINISELEQFEKNSITNDGIEKIKARKDGYALINGEIVLARNIKSKLLEQNIKLIKDSVDSQNELEGKCAQGGKARGKVRLVLYKSQVPDFKKGEILVTEMTSPDFLPAMARAAAIITDEGGLTCHAAISARELKIPCVVGADTATQVLKDGDVIEVDANKGEIMIIK